MKKHVLFFVLLFALSCYAHSQQISSSFAQIYTTLDKLNYQVKDLNLSLVTQQALALQLQNQLNEEMTRLESSQKDYAQAQRQLEQSKTMLNQASQNAETLQKQLLHSESRLKIWKHVAIIAAPTAVVSTAALIIVLINK